MERGSLEKLKFDRRLRLRDGWAADEEINSFLAALPDVSDKIAVESEEPAAPSVSQPAAESADNPGDGLLGSVSEPHDAHSVQGAPADVPDEPVDPLSAPPFKEV